MRCDVLGNRVFENSVDDDGHLNTDIQVWRENTEQQQQQRKQQQQQHQQQQQRSTSVIPCESCGFTRMYPGGKSYAIADGGAVTNPQRYCLNDDHDGGDMHNHRLVRSSYHNEIAGPDNKSSACDSEEEEDDEEDENEENLVEAALPAVSKKRRRGLRLRKLKSNCKPEELQKLKTQCEVSCRNRMSFEISLKY